jgi:3-deoxy-manno-octulosonate cytidylyltransferase (CMP-KDO synthetase)
MIEHVYRRAAAARTVDAVVVATDDPRIAAAIESFGGIARLTRATHRTGTDRLAEVAADLEADIVLNVQGDEPLMDPATIDAVVEPLLGDSTLEMSTACTALAAEDHANPNVVKVVRDLNGDALYFSRAPIRAASKHLGIYGYRRAFLLRFAQLEPTPLELAESLEQLRALEHGVRIRTVVTPYDSIGVDTPEDLERVRQHTLAARA